MSSVPAQLELVTDSFPDDPALDMAVSRALMQRVATGELPDTLRIARPGPSVVFGKRDVIGPGYAPAVTAARAAGFEAVERLAGGRAAVFHEGTISIAHTLRDPEPRAGVTARFEATAELVARALTGLGVRASVGEIPGEYCPGAHSVNARGATKLAGLGQRIVREGVHLGGVVVVDGADRARDVLVPVYAELGLDWRPETTGSAAAEVEGVTWEQAAAAIEAEYARLYDLKRAEIDETTLTLARRLAPEHLAPVSVER